VSPKERWIGRKATDEQHQAVEVFIQKLEDPDFRKEFTQDPEQALGQMPYSNLPPDLRGFLEALSVEELGLLYRLSRTAGDVGLYADHGGFTWCHL
jgi:hypothetical protein